MSDISEDLMNKRTVLIGILKKTGGVAVAFSGGVDSTFLAAVACEVLGKRAIAVTATSPLYPEHERQEAIEWANEMGMTHIIVASNELKVPGFADNPPDRCYRCKSELFALVRKEAEKYDISVVADGSNVDDLSDYRPGARAVKECGVLSPLLEAGLNKEDIRALSRQMNLPTAEKPAFACLASRFPYGQKITEEKLHAVGMVENEIRALGFRQWRVRYHDTLARIEVEADEISRLLEPDIRQRIVQAAHQAGFLYVSVDLEGYRMGSMNTDIVKN